MCKTTNNLLLTILKVHKRFSNVYDDDSIYISRDFLIFFLKIYYSKPTFGSSDSCFVHSRCLASGHNLNNSYYGTVRSN